MNEYQILEGFYNCKRFWNSSNGVGFDKEIKTGQEQITLQKQPKYLDCEAQSSLKFSQFEKFQEIISISSDSEEETKSELKNSDRDLWKFRLPKKSSKYIRKQEKTKKAKIMTVG